MAIIVKMHNETPVAFIRRNGPTLTIEVAQRFGMDRRIALKMLRRLERAGEIRSRRIALSSPAAGTGLEWTVEAEDG
jgi:hypothetical protein